MKPKKSNVNGNNDKKRKETITIELKKEIIEKYERGFRVTELAKLYSRTSSTICTILKRKEVIKSLNPAKGVTRLSKQRSSIIDELEKLLLVWINAKQLTGDAITETIICQKARSLFLDLQLMSPDASSEDTFKASRGWFEKFKRRSGIQSVLKHWDAVKSDNKAAEGYVEDFMELIRTEGYVSQQVFNCVETGLFWRKMLKKTISITNEEMELPAHNSMRDKLTLLFCANASGDYKVKPLLVYHSENPRAFIEKNIEKDKLQVMWRANPKIWVTRQLFIEWINEVFGPSVKRYLLENNLPLKVLLILDNTPAYPLGLEDYLFEEFQFIRVSYLPPNTTPILQPMNQRMIVNFRKLYTKHLFRKCFEFTLTTKKTLMEFWKEHYDIVNCLEIINKAWKGVTKKVLISSWRKLWSVSSDESDFEGLELEEYETMEEIVYFCQTMGLKIGVDDINELVEEHREELTTEELQELQKEQEIVEEKTFSETVDFPEAVDLPEDRISSAEIKVVLEMWQTVSEFVDKHHPDKRMSNRAANLFYHNGLSHFFNVLRQRTTHDMLESQPVKQLSSLKSDSSDNSNVVKKPKLDNEDSNSQREKTPEFVLPDVIITEEDPPHPQLPHC